MGTARRTCDDVAQLVEQVTVNHRVVGSSPSVVAFRNSKQVCHEPAGGYNDLFIGVCVARTVMSCQGTFFHLSRKSAYRFRTAFWADQDREDGKSN